MRKALSIISRISLVALWATAFLPSVSCGGPMPLNRIVNVQMPSCCKPNHCCGHHCDMARISLAKDSAAIQVSAKKFRPLESSFLTSLPTTYWKQIQSSLLVFNHNFSDTSPPGFSAVLRI